MTTIVFERNPGVYLPEISAYRRYIKKNLPEFSTFDSSKIDDYNPMDFDVVWRFMGLDTKGTGRKVIHAYNSLSTGRFPRLKNRVKQTINVKPHARVFLNETVKKGFFFADNIPFKYRDMGVDSTFFQQTKTAPEYDFVYAGSLDRGVAISSVLNHFQTILKTSTLLIIGAMPEDLLKEYENTTNIIFTGRVPYEEVAALMAKARYGLNLMPDQYPFNLQTATKVLEYCALSLPVVSTDYRWIRQFEKERKRKFFILESHLGNFTIKNLEKHSFKIPQIDNCEWESVIESSKIFDLLR